VWRCRCSFSDGVPVGDELSGGSYRRNISYIKDLQALVKSHLETPRYRCLRSLRRIAEYQANKSRAYGDEERDDVVLRKKCVAGLLALSGFQAFGPSSHVSPDWREQFPLLFFASFITCCFFPVSTQYQLHVGRTSGVQKACSFVTFRPLSDESCLTNAWLASGSSHDLP
jgi:hypothetical protein